MSTMSAARESLKFTDITKGITACIYSSPFTEFILTLQAPQVYVTPHNDVCHCPPGQIFSKRFLI